MGKVISKNSFNPVHPTYYYLILKEQKIIHDYFYIYD